MTKNLDKLKNNYIIRNIYTFVYRLIATLFWNSKFLFDRLFHKECLYGCCFVFSTPFGRMKKNNWGDDLNIYLFQLLSKKQIRFVPFEKLFFSPAIIRYSLIGSIIGDFNLDNTIVYGSGAITYNPKIIGKPIKVFSVRGPRTREVLIGKGIECPEVYGDPALLTSKVYHPNIQKKNIIGIIPHYRTLESDWQKSTWFEELSSKYIIEIIDMSRYEKWTDVIDKICCCKYVVSESLHGIIISESYSVPSIWVEFIEHNCSWEWEFKFLDFYESINKLNEKCIKLYENRSIQDIFDKLDSWKPGYIDYDSMIKNFPFELKDDLFCG